MPSFRCLSERPRDFLIQGEKIFSFAHDEGTIPTVAAAPRLIDASMIGWSSCSPPARAAELSQFGNIVV